MTDDPNLFRPLPAGARRARPKKDHPFKNVAVPEDIHSLLRQLAEREQRSMAKQISFMTQQYWRDLNDS